eukprot:gene14905-biopygen1087
MLLEAAQVDWSSCLRLVEEATQAARGCSRRLLKLLKAAREGCSSCSRLLEGAAQAPQDCSRLLEDASQGA